MTPENRNLIMAVALSMIVLLGWQIFVIQPEMEKEAAEQERIAAEMAQSAAIANDSGQPSASAASGTPAIINNTAPAKAVDTAKRIVIDAPLVRGSFSVRGARLDDVILTSYNETLDENSENIHFLKKTSSNMIAGRSVGEILKRFDAKIKDPRQANRGKKVSKIINSFLKIKCPINKAAEVLNNFFKTNRINLAVDQKYFPISHNKISKLNVVFDSSFGRQQEYYTGLVFKIDIKSKSKNISIISGGRYDKLISDLGSKNQVAAVGAALNLNFQ